MLTKKELKRFKTLLSKPEEDLTDKESEELDTLEVKLNEPDNVKKDDGEETPKWATKLIEMLSTKPELPDTKPQKVPVPPAPEPEEPEEPEPEPEPQKKKNGFLSWLL